MRACVRQRERPALAVATEDQRHFEQHSFGETVTKYLVSRKGTIPEPTQHEGVGTLALRSLIEHCLSGHMDDGSVLHRGESGKASRDGLSLTHRCYPSEGTSSFPPNLRCRRAAYAATFNRLPHRRMLHQRRVPF